MDFSLWLAFVAASFALLLIPGPTILLVLSYALTQGRKVAIATASGVALGDLIAMSASLIGLGALIATSALAFSIVKWSGAAYLVYLGFKMLRNAPKEGAGLVETDAQATPQAVFWHSAFVTALNPKSIGFFIAFVPQFISVEASYAPQAAILITTFVSLAAINSLAYALLADVMRRQISRPTVMRRVTQAGGISLIGMGAATAALKMRMMRGAAIALLLLLNPLNAQEFLSTEVALNDDDFYRIVSCAAPPDGACGKPTVRWAKNELSVGITKLDKAYLGGKKVRAEAALSRAIDEINNADSLIRLVRDNDTPDIPILFLNIPARSTIQGSGYAVLEGKPISAAGVRVFAKDGVILKSVIIVTTGLQKRAYESVMLEEIMQGLGFLTDIGGTYYESRSIFSQSSNALTKLGKQDVMALGRHYPAR